MPKEMPLKFRRKSDGRIIDILMPGLEVSEEIYLMRDQHMSRIILGEIGKAYGQWEARKKDA